MKYSGFLILFILLIPFIYADTEKWTVHDIYQKRHWKIISYDHNSQGYSVLMKQINHYLIKKVDKGSIQAEVDYKFCNEYRYKVAKENDAYKITHQFFSKFGKDGIIEFPSGFKSDMKSIDPHFENFMREILGQKKEKIHVQKLTRKEWKYKAKPLDTNKIWTIKKLSKYPSYYVFNFENQILGRRTLYIFQNSEKYFFIEKLFNKIPKSDFIKNYWTRTKFPLTHFYKLIIKEIGIDPNEVKYQKKELSKWTSNTIMRALPDNNNFKKEYYQQLYSKFPDLKDNNLKISQLGSIIVRYFNHTYGSDIIFQYIHHGMYKNGTTESHYELDSKRGANIFQYLKSLETLKFNGIIHESEYGEWIYEEYENRITEQ